MRTAESRRWICVLGSLCAAVALGDSPTMPAAPQRAEPAPSVPVTETLWGQKVTDNYRYMEDMGPETLRWMTAQGSHARATLDAIGARSALATTIAEFTAGIGSIESHVRYGGRDFYQERAPGSDNFDLVASDPTGERKIIDVDALRAARGGKPVAINYFYASPDGSKVAAGISEGDSEEANLYVYDAATGKQIAGPIDRTDPGEVAWSADGTRLYFPRLKQLAPGQDEAEKYNLSLYAWDMKSAPTPVMGSAASRGPKINTGELPKLILVPGSAMAIAASINGVQPELALWLTPKKHINDPTPAWVPLVSRKDEVTAVEMSGENLYLLSHKDAPTFKVLSLRSGQPFKAARVLVPAARDRVIDSIHAAADALYVLARHGAYSVMLRVPRGSTMAEEVALPFKGHITEIFSDPRAPGVMITLESFVVPPVSFMFDAASKRFVQQDLGGNTSVDAARYEISDLEARAEDGVMVPNTYVRRKDAIGPQIVLIQAYGAYGISQLANFSRRAALLLQAGGAYASCHVRGGGELGDAWRLAGKDANKPHTWHDLIACAEDLIARGYTSKDKLFILGGSAGGIAVGRAMTDRPDLFAGVIALVPAVNTLREEVQPAGVVNIPEFGSVKTRDGFRNLFEMDTIQHIREGVQYPAVLISTGLNDARVSPWEPAKFAAALQASGTKRPVLLRVDADAGHGFGSTKTQEDAQFADIISFVFWQAGLPNWQPQFGGR